MKHRPFLRLAVLASGCGRLDGVLDRDLDRAVTPGVIAAVALATFAIGVLGLALPFTLVQVYDRIVAYRAEATLAWLFGGCALALGLEAALSLVRGLLTSWASARISTAYEVRLVDALLEADKETVLKTGPGTHLERLDAGRNLADPLCQALVALNEAPFLLVYLGTLAVLGHGLFLVPLGALAVQFAVMVAAGPRMAANHRNLADREEQRVEDITRALSSIGFVKAQALEPFLTMRFERTQTRQAVASFEVLGGERLMQEVLRVLTTAATFGLLVAGAGAVAGGSLTIGALSTAVLLSGRAIGAAQGPLRIALRRSDLSRTVREAKAALMGRTFTEAPRKPLPLKADSRLEFSDVAFGAGTPGACEGVSLILRPGDAVCLEDDGTRWTSAFCLLAAGLRQPDRGSIHLDVYPLDRWDPGTGGLVAYVPPKGELLPGTLLDNLTGFYPPLREAALDAAAILGLDRTVSRLARGYDTPVDPRSEVLPASVVQRLHVARALARRPRLLVWDHSDSVMDQEGRNQVLEVLGRLAGSTTLVIASDRPEFLVLGRRTVCRSSGRLTAEGRP